MKVVNSGDAHFDAAVQCLVHVPQFAAYVTSSGIDDFQKKRVNACRLATAIFGIVTEYWGSTPPPHVIDASEAYAAFCKANRTQSARQHKDAQETFRMLLRGIHDALGKTPPVESPAERFVARQPWEQYNQVNGYSILTEIFQGQLEIRSEPIDGGRVDVHHEHFWDLSFSVDENSLEGCVSKFIAPHHVVADGRRVSRRFAWLPLALVVHFKRFSDKFVDYAVDIELHDASGPVRYALVALCVPEGTVTEVAGTWTHAGRGETKRLDNLNSIIQRDAYTLVYKRL